MKVILLQDVAKIGKRSNLVEVPDGYAMNHLIPKGLAEAATAANKKRIDKLQQAAEVNKAAEETHFEASHKALLEKVIKIETEVNEQGHLFKAVSEIDIADAAMTAGIDIDAAMIMIESPIKEVGEHVVGLNKGSKKAEFTIAVAKK
jgi:large subunit ribosomal protein L9